MLSCSRFYMQIPMIFSWLWTVTRMRILFVLLALKRFCLSLNIRDTSGNATLSTLRDIPKLFRFQIMPSIWKLSIISGPCMLYGIVAEWWLRHDEHYSWFDIEWDGGSILLEFFITVSEKPRYKNSHERYLDVVKSNVTFKVILISFDSI